MGIKPKLLSIQEMLNILNKVDVTKNVSHKTITKALGISVST
jgi:hypothetical protein